MNYKQRIHGSDLYNSSFEHERPEVGVMRTCCRWKDLGGKQQLGKEYLQLFPFVTESTYSFRLTFAFIPFISLGGRGETARR